METTFLELKPDIKVTVPRKLFATLCGRKMYLNINFGIPTPNNIGDMQQTHFPKTENRGQGLSQSDPKVVCDPLPPKIYPQTKLGVPMSKT